MNSEYLDQIKTYLKLWMQRKRKKVRFRTNSIVFNDISFYFKNYILKVSNEKY